jgi:transposase
MSHLDEVSVEELQDALDGVEKKQPAERLLAAIAYKNGVTQTELARWHDVRRRTIYNWLTRLDTAGSLEHAATDDHRDGRKRKLSDTQLTGFRNAVRASPDAVGMDAPGWTPALARRYLARIYGVEYSIPSCRRLLREAGLRYQKPYWTVPDHESTRAESSDDPENGGGRAPR